MAWTRRRLLAGTAGLVGMALSAPVWARTGYAQAMESRAFGTYWLLRIGAEVDPTAYDAVFLAGGQSPMVTMIDDTALHAFVARAYEAGRVVAIVCHGTCILLKTRLTNGELLVKGGLLSRQDLQTALARKMGFPVVDVASFPIEADALRKIPFAMAKRL